MTRMWWKMQVLASSAAPTACWTDWPDMTSIDGIALVELVVTAKMVAIATTSRFHKHQTGQTKTQFAEYADAPHDAVFQNHSAVAVIFEGETDQLAGEVAVAVLEAAVIAVDKVDAAVAFVQNPVVALGFVRLDHYELGCFVENNLATSEKMKQSCRFPLSYASP